MNVWLQNTILCVYELCMRGSVAGVRCASTGRVQNNFKCYLKGKNEFESAQQVVCCWMVSVVICCWCVRGSLRMGATHL